MYTLVALVTLVALLGCLAGRKIFDSPLPAGLANPHLLRLDGVKSVCVQAIAVLASRLGLGDFLQIHNQLDSYAFSFLMDSHAGLEVRKAEIDGVPVVVYKPLSVTGTLPAVVYFHGGGFIFGSHVYVDPVTSAIARDTPALVVSVDYRLAPEHPYPAGLDDCFAVTKYLLHHPTEFDLDPRRIALAGDSAGANLAAAVALKFRDSQAQVQPKLQVLIQAILQTCNFRLPSYQIQLLNSREDIAFATSVYMGDDRFLELLEMPPEVKLIASNRHTSMEMKRAFQHIFDLSLIPEEMRQGYKPEETTEPADEALVAKCARFVADPYMSPLLADNKGNLPPAFIMTSEYDALRDDGILYAKHLERAGVPVTWYHSSDTYHGGFIFVGPRIQADTAVRDVKKVIAFLKDKL